MFRQATLFDLLPAEFDSSLARVERRDLDERTWIEHCPNWLTGADGVFDQLVDSLPFRQRTGIPMYDQMVDEPRLTAWWSLEAGGDEPLPMLRDMRLFLAERYEEPFDSIGFNLYRDRHDSVAWHGDRHRHVVTNPVVAIVSVGCPRPLRLRPRGGGASINFDLGDGDLFVMGGACQHEWEHAVPKVRGVVGPRLSITFRSV
ncbi:MAG: alpha-ketoglutarate-dependent dioxygenase AlkB [Ilumatobacteraceae bacterium]